MAVNGERKTILLATRSPILAPLYLARTYRPEVFENIDFEYRPNAANNANFRDRLVEEVLSSADHNQRYIAGIADPFRALPKKTDRREEPVIVANIVRNQLYWLVSECKNPPAKASDFPAHFNMIISQPSYMSSYSVLVQYLRDVCGMQSSEEIKAMIWPNAAAGYERDYYRKCVRQNFGKKFAYITTDPKILYNNKMCREISNFGRDASCSDTLMTAMFCSSGSFDQNYDTIQKIKDVLKESIDMIYSDQLAAAAYLRDARHDGVSFFGPRFNFSSLCEVISKFSRDKVFSRDLRISAEQIRRGAALRTFGMDIRGDENTLLDPDDLINYVDPDVRADVTDPARLHTVVATTPITPMPIRDHVFWKLLRKIFENNRKITSPGPLSDNPLWSWMLGALALCTAFCSFKLVIYPSLTESPVKFSLKFLDPLHKLNGAAQFIQSFGPIAVFGLSLIMLLIFLYGVYRTQLQDKLDLNDASKAFASYVGLYPAIILVLGSGAYGLSWQGEKFLSALFNKINGDGSIQNWFFLSIPHLLFVVKQGAPPLKEFLFERSWGAKWDAFVEPFRIFVTNIRARKVSKVMRVRN